MSDTDRAWRYFGTEDPYFGVLTAGKFSREQLDDDARLAFFASGDDYVDRTFETVAKRLDVTSRPARALDFGCGVGRLSLPLARRCESVVGVDVSEAMLDEARQNARAAGLTNLTFVVGDDTLSRVEGVFDLVHSFIVFQHIRPKRGEALARGLVDRLKDGGVGILHFTYASLGPAWRRGLTAAYARVPRLYGLRNLAKGEPFDRPQMQMNTYNVNRLLTLLQTSGCHDVHLQFSEASHYGYPVFGVSIYFKKEARDTRAHS